MTTGMRTLRIAHFNDVYRVSPQKLKTGTISVSHFATLLEQIRGSWPKNEGLTLFSGDLFSPSVESSITRGSHMVPVINMLAPDVSMAGNHDFDFGYPHLTKLVQDCHFPWLLSNVLDLNTSRVPEHLQRYHIIERSGLKIGIIGLVEKEWIATVSSWPSNFVYQDMVRSGIRLSQRLRDELGCDFIIALTHARLPNVNLAFQSCIKRLTSAQDIQLAKKLFASPPSAQAESSIVDKHGVDLILGGHDHMYYVSKGVNSWDGFNLEETVLGAERDQFDVLVIKSGTDFRDFSEITLELKATPEGSVRKVVIESIRGTRHSTKPDSETLPGMDALLKTLLGSVSHALKAPACTIEKVLDVRSHLIRTAESSSGNWFADILRCVYDDALCMQGGGGSDAVFICAGTLRGDSTYGPGVITLGDILEILPFEDPIIVIEVDGKTIWDALESALSTWPAQEGRFPVISGLRVSWDSRRSPGQRVLGVWLVKEDLTSGSAESVTTILNGPEVKNMTGGRKYKLVTRDYMAQGHDGYDAFQGCRHLIDDETGQMMSTLVRRYLMGSHFIKKMARLVAESSKDCSHLHEATQSAISIEGSRKERRRFSASALFRFRRAAETVIEQKRKSRAHYMRHINAPTRDHMSEIDAFDGGRARKGEKGKEDEHEIDKDLLHIDPHIDGRLKDEGREQDLAAAEWASAHVF